jgi:N-acyl-D-amino-acid deacylase
MFDILLKNGRIIDGTGNPWYQGDVAVKDRVIVGVGRVDGDAGTVVDASRLVVSPGFIDTHSHSDLFLISEPEASAKVMQGITTEIVGQDGLGEAPIRDDEVAEWRRYLAGLNGDPEIDWDWRSFSEYLNRIEAANPSINVVSLVGHGNLRLLAMGMEDRQPTREEMEEMKALLSKSMEQGAIGLSTGLIYAPCVYAGTEELVELCRTVTENDGVFVVHMRNEGDRLLESMDEVVEVGYRSGVHVHISHFKAGGEANWGKSKHSLRKLEEARDEGVQVSYDQYPYTAGSTFLSSLLPPWVHDGGVDSLLNRLKDPDIRTKIISELDSGEQGGRTRDWDQLLVTYLPSEKNRTLEGATMNEIAKRRGQTEVEALMDLILEEDNRASMASFTMSEEDVRRIMKHPLGMMCTDGILLGTPHPRAYGAFPRVLGHYVREDVLRLEEAVQRVTSRPAQCFKLHRRGILRPGFHADITVFDPETIRDTASYQNPRQHPEGIRYVIVNGKITVDNGVHTGEGAGMVLRHKDYS